MNQVVTTERLPIKLWLDDLEDSALEQAKNLANLPFAFKHVAILSDAHTGIGCPIGTVVATEDVIVVNIVGVDISCGIQYLETNIKVGDVSKDDLKRILGLVRDTVPVGLNGKHPTNKLESFMPPIEQECLVVKTEWVNAVKSLKSLGSGNHFIEFQQNDEGNLCFMVHCGSRNLGHKVSSHYEKVAKALNEKYYSSVPSSWRLAFLPSDTREAKLYLNEMIYCMAYALMNRELITDAILNAATQVLGPVYTRHRYDVSHNFVRREHHFGKNLWVHRKGATSARSGEIGIIPGSQGTKSYIVSGKGNPESFTSSSHGSGRKMSRIAAKKNLNLADEIKLLDDQGIIHGIRNEQDLDEAASAYKDINVVMANQADLVDIIDTLTPLAVIKG